MHIFNYYAKYNSIINCLLSSLLLIRIECKNYQDPLEILLRSLDCCHRYCISYQFLVHSPNKYGKLLQVNSVGQNEVLPDLHPLCQYLDVRSVSDIDKVELDDSKKDLMTRESNWVSVGLLFFSTPPSPTKSPQTRNPKLAFQFPWWSFFQLIWCWTVYPAIDSVSFAW